MFKRIAKRERKREREEELGLDEGMKQVLGLQDTDSDESFDSSSDSESDAKSAIDTDEIDSEDPALTDHILRKRKHSTQSLDSSDSDAIHEKSDPASKCSDVEDEADESDENGPPMGVMAATTDPIYDLPNTPQTLDLRACIICPGKLIKNPRMAKEHLESNAHRRRLQRYTAEVSKRASSREGLSTDDPRDILRDMSGTVNYGSQVAASKRSQRRTQRKEEMAERRKTRKEKRKIAMERAKETDRDKSGDGGTMKRTVRKVNKDANVLSRPGDMATVEVSRTPKPADARDTEPTRSGPVAEPNFDESQYARPKKRQKREAAVDSTPSLSGIQFSSAHSTKFDMKRSADPSHGKSRTGAPPLKRNNTSFYFADDEEAQPAPITAKSKKPSKDGGIVDGTKDRKPVKSKPKPVRGAGRDVDGNEDGRDHRSGSQDALKRVKKLTRESVHASQQGELPMLRIFD